MSLHGRKPNYSVNRTLTRYAGSHRLPQALGCMRPIALLPLTCLLVSGCAGFLRSQPPEAKQLAAELTYVAGDMPLEPGSGIASVGNYYFPQWLS